MLLLKSQPKPMNLSPSHPGRQRFSLPATTSTLPGVVQLSFEDLAAFDQVKDQYRGLGVWFEGAIAIKPSNPLFPPHSGSLVIMPVGSHPELAVYFRHPTQMMGVFVTGARRVKMVGFDTNGNVVDQVSTSNCQYLQQDVERQEALPRQLLRLSASGIVKVVLESDGPFVLDDFFYDVTSCSIAA